MEKVHAMIAQTLFVATFKLKGKKKDVKDNLLGLVLQKETQIQTIITPLGGSRRFFRAEMVPENVRGWQVFRGGQRRQKFPR